MISENITVLLSGETTCLLSTIPLPYLRFIQEPKSHTDVSSCLCLFHLPLHQNSFGFLVLFFLIFRRIFFGSPKSHATKISRKPIKNDTHSVLENQTHNTQIFQREDFLRLYSQGLCLCLGLYIQTPWPHQPSSEPQFLHKIGCRHIICICFWDPCVSKNLWCLEISDILLMPSII